MNQVRRVVTGHTGGRSVFVSDEQVEAMTWATSPTGGMHVLWGADKAPTFPDDGAMPEHASFFPPLGGFRFIVVTMPPAGTPPADVDVATTVEMEQKFPGLAAHMERDNPGMHTTDTVDFEVVLSGEVVLELDDGSEKVLHAGDTVVQNGTRHRWHNRTSEPAVYVAFLVGAERL